MRGTGPSGFDGGDSGSSAQEARRWDDFVASSPHGHLLQSSLWGELKTRFGWGCRRVCRPDAGNIAAGAQVLYRTTPLGSFAYIPRGPVVDLDQPEPLGALLEDIHLDARKSGAIFLRIEPDRVTTGLLPRLGFRAADHSIQPQATVMIDLSPGLEDIQAQQKPKTRYNIKLAARKGVTVAPGSLADLPDFYSLLQVTAARDGFGIHSLPYYQTVLDLFGDGARLFLARYEGELLAGIIVAAFGTLAIYLYGASGNSHRNLMPNHLLQWEAMKWAKSVGCSRYDLWGIPDLAPGIDPTGIEAEGVAMAGLYRFKTGFGGEIMRFASGYDHVYSPPRYLLWRLAVRLRRRMRGGFGE